MTARECRRDLYEHVRELYTYFETVFEDDSLEFDEYDLGTIDYLFESLVKTIQELNIEEKETRRSKGKEINRKDEDEWAELYRLMMKNPVFNNNSYDDDEDEYDEDDYDDAYHYTPSCGGGGGGSGISC